MWGYYGCQGITVMQNICVIRYNIDTIIFFNSVVALAICWIIMTYASSCVVAMSFLEITIPIDTSFGTGSQPVRSILCLNFCGSDACLDATPCTYHRSEETQLLWQGILISFWFCLRANCNARCKESSQALLHLMMVLILRMIDFAGKDD